MSLFDAVCHAMSTVATGGFSTHDASFGFWDSPLLEAHRRACSCCSAAINFGMHWYAWRRATLAHYQADSELRAFLLIALVVGLLVTLQLWLGGRFASFGESLRHGIFQAVSNLTTTGFVTTGFADWPGAAPLLLILLGFIGGCVGLHRRRHEGGARGRCWCARACARSGSWCIPKGQFVVKVGGKRVSESVVISVAGFFTLYVLQLRGADRWCWPRPASTSSPRSPRSPPASTTSGPGLGDVAVHFRDAQRLRRSGSAASR